MKEIFPNNATGDALRRLQRSGDQLKASRDVDFSVVFTTREGADSFIARFGAQVDCIRLTHRPEQSRHPWDVTATKSMVPAYTDITNMEIAIDNIARALGGENDGWGCFEVVD